MKVYRDPSDPSILRIRDSNPTIIAPVIEKINTDEKYEDYVARWIDTHPELCDQSIEIWHWEPATWMIGKRVFIAAFLGLRVEDVGIDEVIEYIHEDSENPYALRISGMDCTDIESVIEEINTKGKYCRKYRAKWIDKKPELDDQFIEIWHIVEVPWETAKEIIIEEIDNVVSEIKNLSSSSSGNRKIRTACAPKNKRKPPAEESVGLPVDEEESIGLPGDEEESVGLPGDEEESVGLPGGN